MESILILLLIGTAMLMHMLGGKEHDLENKRLVPIRVRKFG